MAETKAIFVDGSSFWNMGRILGIKPSFKELYTVLSSIGDTPHLFGKPVYTLAPKAVSLEKPLKAVGFEVVNLESTKEEDSVIINRINSLSSRDITEIVLVSSDIADYFDALRAKGVQGVKVSLVATKSPDPVSGRSSLPLNFDNLLEENSWLRFVELLDFKDRIMEEPWRPTGRTNTRRKVAILFSVPAADLSSVLGMIGPLAERVDSLEIKIGGSL